MSRSVPNRALPQSIHQKDAFASRLGIEELIGLYRLLQLEFMGELGIHIDIAFGHEFGAVGLTILAEGPGADDRDLSADHVV